MPAKDIYHDTVKTALTKDGWTITHDPLRLRWGSTDLYVDLGAEQLLAAEKTGRKIAIEVKSFIGSSKINDLENAFGQYALYQEILTRQEPDRVLYLAISEEAFLNVFEESLGKLFLESNRVNLVVFDYEEEVILRWIP